MACNGSIYLAVWQDYRNNTTTGADIIGTRVKKDGKVLDPLGIPICTVPGDQGNPSLAASHTDFMLAWEDKHVPPQEIEERRALSA